MKRKVLILFIFVFAMSFIIYSCNKESELNISYNAQSKSHKMGENCMSCHKTGGEGKGIFNVAGTVYDASLTTASANGNLKLYTLPDAKGTLVSTIEVDAKGNFFTTDKVDFGTGLYAIVSNATGGSKNMSSIISSGQCNSCHGASQDKIWVD
jgi:hypothetical protein